MNVVVDSLGRLTVREAARRLGVHENTVRNWVDSGKLRADRLPSGHRRIHPEDVDAILRRRGGDA